MLDTEALFSVWNILKTSTLLQCFEYCSNTDYKTPVDGDILLYENCLLDRVDIVCSGNIESQLSIWFDDKKTEASHFWFPYT